METGNVAKFGYRKRETQSNFITLLNSQCKTIYLQVILHGNLYLKLLVSRKISPWHIGTSGFYIALHITECHLYELDKTPSGFSFLIPSNHLNDLVFIANSSSSNIKIMRNRVSDDAMNNNIKNIFSITFSEFLCGAIQWCRFRSREDDSAWPEAMCVSVYIQRQNVCAVH